MSKDILRRNGYLLVAEPGGCHFGHRISKEGLCHRGDDRSTKDSNEGVGGTHKESDPGSEDQERPSTGDAHLKSIFLEHIEGCEVPGHEHHKEAKSAKLGQ
jgi:hypothetical protein